MSDNQNKTSNVVINAKLINDKLYVTQMFAKNIEFVLNLLLHLLLGAQSRNIYLYCTAIITLYRIATLFLTMTL